MQITQIMLKMLSIAKYKIKALKKERKMKSKKYRKNQTSAVNSKI